MECKRLNSRNRILDTKELDLLQTELGEDIEPRTSLRSQTKVDTGGWLGNRPIWVSVTEEEILLCAAGKRPFFERVQLQDCTDSHYNPATGEVVIAPSEALICNQLTFHPGEAMALLTAIGIEESKWIGIDTPESMDEENPVASILHGLSAEEEPVNPEQEKDYAKTSNNMDPQEPDKSPDPTPPKFSKFAKYKAKNQ